VVACVAWPCSLHELVLVTGGGGGTPEFVPGLTDNSQQVKVEDGGKQCGQRGQAMMTVPVFFCTEYSSFFV